MKPLFILVLSLAITLEGFCQTGEEPTTDSIKTEQTYSVAPFLKKQTVKKSSIPVYTIDDPSILQFSNGNTILNSLKGQVPNLNNILYSVDLRLHTPMVLVDGVPFSSEWSRFYNTNAFDFDQVLAINSGNYSPLFGSYAANGLLSLQSKTGKGLSKPTFSFNENVNYQWSDRANAFGASSYKNDQWIFSSNLSYGQDFGKIDTRVSYNYASSPNENAKFNQHSLRVNTGFEITPKLTGKLIIEDNLSFSNQHNPYRSNYISESTNNLFNGNLFLTYSILDWLSVSTQLSYSAIITDTEDVRFISHENKTRQYGNLFLRATKEIFKGFSVSPFVGGKLENIGTYRENSYQGSMLNSSTNFKNPSWTVGTELSYLNYVSTSFSIGKESPSYLPEETKTLSYSIGGSFIFSEIISRTSDFWSLGKVRINYNQIGRSTYFNFPYTPDNLIQDNFPYNMQQFETGFDLTFFSNRIGLSYTYFNSIRNNIPPFDQVARSSAYTAEYINIGDLKTSGSEVVLYCDIIKKNQILLRSSVTWGNTKQSIISNIPNSTIIIGSPNIVSPIGGPRDLIGAPIIISPTRNPGTLPFIFVSPIPKWTSYWTNHLSINGFTARVITGLTYGRGVEFNSQLNSGTLTYNTTYFDLAEVGLFYSFKKLIRSQVITDLNVGIVGRNTAKVYYKTDVEVNDGPFQNPKNISFNVGITF